MMRALWSAATGMKAQQLNVDTISNNLSNVNTTGFKKNRVDFQDLIYQRMRAAGSPTTQGAELPIGIMVGHGVREIATPKIFTQGALQETGNELDIAIQGDGFFQIVLPDGTLAYTRDGSFKQDSTGRLLTSNGFALEPEIVIPQDATSIQISQDGTVSVTIAGQVQPQEVGQITLARFINPAGLEAIGSNLFVQTGASGDPLLGTPGLEGFGILTQGFLEQSNVQVVEEIINLIVAQRAYEANARSVTTADQMLQEANNLRR